MLNVEACCHNWRIPEADQHTKPSISMVKVCHLWHIPDHVLRMLDTFAMGDYSAAIRLGRWLSCCGCSQHLRKGLLVLL